MEGDKLSEETARKAAAALVRRAMELGSTDNATAVVLLPEWVERVPRASAQVVDGLPSPVHANALSSNKENMATSGPAHQREKVPRPLEDMSKPIGDVRRLMSDMSIQDSLALS